MPTSLVHTLQFAALDPVRPVDDLLRLALVVARKLNVSEIEEWISSELNGYGSNTELPSYRVVKGELKGIDPDTGNLLPIVLRQPNIAAAYGKRRLTQSISEIEHLVAACGRDGEVYSRTHAEAENLLREHLGSRPPTQIGVVVYAPQIRTVLSMVRNRVIEWATKLEQMGILGDGITFTQQEQEKATHVTNITIMGSVHGSQIQQNAAHAEQTTTPPAVDLAGC